MGLKVRSQWVQAQIKHKKSCLTYGKGRIHKWFGRFIIENLSFKG